MFYFLEVHLEGYYLIKRKLLFNKKVLLENFFGTLEKTEFLDKYGKPYQSKRHAISHTTVTINLNQSIKKKIV